MATIIPNLTSKGPDTRLIEWIEAATGDTIVPHQGTGSMPAISSVQFDGTFGGATVTLAASNDGLTFYTLKDTSGDLISFTAAGYAELSTAALFVVPVITGGTGDNISVYMVTRR